MIGISYSSPYPGVQAFIAESRSTADVAAGSDVMSDLARAMLEAVAEPARLVIPSRSTTAALPNRVVALTPAGTGVELARRVVASVETAWAAKVEDLWRRDRRGVPVVPGFPDAQWVVVEATAGDYAAQWTVAQRGAGREEADQVVPVVRRSVGSRAVQLDGTLAGRR